MQVCPQNFQNKRRRTNRTHSNETSKKGNIKKQMARVAQREMLVILQTTEQIKLVNTLKTKKVFKK